MGIKLLAINLALAVSAVLLWMADARLESAAARRLRQDSIFLGLGTAPAAADGVMRMDLGIPGSPARWTYLRRGGAWRLPQYRDGFADGQLVEGLMRSLLESRGTAVGTKPRDEERFGLQAGACLTIDLLGRSDEPLLKARAGRIAPGERSEECFTSAEGDPRILHWQSNPWTYIAWKPEDRLPPLIDAKVVPAALGRRSLQRIILDLPAGGEIREIPGGLKEIYIREIPMTAPPLGRDMGPRFEWHGVLVGGEDRLLNDAAAGGYARFVSTLAFDELVGEPQQQPGAAGDLIGSPALSITLVSSAPAPPPERTGAQAPGATAAPEESTVRDTLTLGSRMQGNLQFLSNSTTRQIFLISREKARQLIPDGAEMLKGPVRDPEPPTGK